MKNSYRQTYESNSINNSMLSGCDEQKIKSARYLGDSSMLSRSYLSGAKNEGDDGVKVVCNIACEGCGGNFKPNSYYRHVTNCRGDKMSNSLITN